ncbi:MAG: chloride channel protein [Asticcacaulis sp.]
MSDLRESPLAKKAGHLALRVFAHLKRRIQSSELWFILLAAGIGLVAGAASAVLAHTAHAIQRLLYGFSADMRLSALPEIVPWRLVALPLGGAVLALIRVIWPNRTRAPIDVIEANALYGGRIPLRDSLVVSLQTLVSNGFGASVGLEAAFAQTGGGGVASKVGQWLNLKRSSLRTLVGAGAGSAIAAAFGAPLAGAFYAFEVVLGGYTIAALAPVAAASLAAVLAAQWMGAEPFVIASTARREIALSGYLLYALLGAISAGLGILIMRLIAVFETLTRRIPVSDVWRPVLGGLCLVPIAFFAPAALSSGHGAMTLYMAQQSTIVAILVVLVLKLMASIVSLSFGFRGGLFFASLFVGALLGMAFAQVVNLIYPEANLDTTNAALVGMAALAAAVIGGPMCMSMMVLSVTNDFALTAAVVTAALVSTAVIRERFGYSFSTWRLHLRGEAIKTARDIGWVRTHTALNLMRKNNVTMSDHASIADLRAQVALGSTNRVLLVDSHGDYRGLVPTAEAYIAGVDTDTPLSQLAKQTEVYVRPDMDIAAIQRVFEHFSVDDLAVVDEHHKLLGMLTERYVNRRYAEALEQAQREFFGEM